MNEYEQKAQDFLKKTNTEFKTEFIEYGLYFDDDKEERDIYQITLKRGDREYNFKFGQSLNDSGLRLFDNNGKQTHHKPFKVPQEILLLLITAETTEQKRRTTYVFKEWFEREHFKLSGLTWKTGIIPTPYDVLASLQKYEVGTLKDFCGDFGYEEDSRKAEKTYKTVVREYDNIKILYSDEEIEALREIS